MNENKPDKPEKDFTIIVNTREKTVSQTEITFGEIIALAYDKPPSGPNVLFTIT
ncbi:MAG: multiubiquitin domain-containing protein, partial [Akkermansiaceae bacterium]